MIFGTDPLTSRTRFKSRGLVNVVTLVVIFLGLVTFCSWVLSNQFASFFPLLISDMAVFVLCAFLYVSWQDRPIRIRCPGCRKIVLSNTPWVCGVCGHENKDTNHFSFLNECAQCHTAPKSYECHHVHKNPHEPKLIYFWEDQDGRTPAQRLDSTVPRARQRAETVFQRSENHADKKHQIDMARMDLIEAQLNERLAALKKRMADESGDNDLESLRKSRNQFMDKWTGVNKLAKEQKQQNAKDFPDDPEALEEYDSVVDAWVFRVKSEGK